MNIDPNEVLPQFCPECGAGDAGNGYFRLPKGFPDDPPCGECDRRARVRMFQAGFKAGYEREKAFMDALLGN